LISMSGSNTRLIEHQRLGNTIVEAIAPQPADIVIAKRGASGFCGTSLMRDLHERAIGTVLVTGTTPSGYVRATGVDAACYSLDVGIAEECYCDRFPMSHRVSLLDMQATYGLVMALAEAAESLCTTARPTPVFHTTPEPVGVRSTSGMSLPVHAAGRRMRSTSGRLSRLSSVTSMKQS
jgi:hypothetical protein